MSELRPSRSSIFDTTAQILIRASTLRGAEVITANDVCEEIDITPRTALRYLDDLCADGYLVVRPITAQGGRARKGYAASDLTKELFGVNTSKLKRAMWEIVNNCKRTEQMTNLTNAQRDAAYHQRMTIQELLDEFF